MWAKRMYQVTAKAEYGDWMENILFNAGISGANLDMTRYFYANPLAHRCEHHIEPTFGQYSHVPNERFFTFDCWCCPPQLLRTFTGMPKWVYSKNEQGVSINLFAGADLDTTLADGSPAKIKMETNYPWDKSVSIRIVKAAQVGFDLTLRIPAWCEKATINGEAASCGIHTIKVNQGDVLNIELPMKPEMYVSHPMLEQSNGMFAVKRGPVVYCVEGQDIAEGVKIDELVLPENANFVEETMKDFPYDMVGLRTEFLRRPHSDSLYCRNQNVDETMVNVRMIPYFAWANREEQDMNVWFPRG
jgi:DUF1680 family protein